MGPLVYYLEYEVSPGPNVAAGLPRLKLTVLSPVWQGDSLALEYPDGEIHTLAGWQTSGEAGSLRVFWTRHQPGAPAVCLVIGAAAGLRNLTTGQGLPFLALVESMIPPEILEVIGPWPQPEPLLLF